MVKLFVAIALSMLSARPMNRTMPRLALCALALMAAVPAAAQNTAPYSVAESGRGYGSLQAAVDAIGNGTGTILISPGVHRDCAVQEGGAVTYRAAVPGKAIFDGGICEDKAALVLRGRAATVNGIIFQNMAVADGNSLILGPLLGDNVVTVAGVAQQRQSPRRAARLDSPSVRERHVCPAGKARISIPGALAVSC